ncbi:hypothetical protein BpHYR1_026479 [Brachionus plicatilis]|uniref:Uncharacterized protein n=1 Tax=Brachionus plicatilis TaxID=10195 RepID=A0A3M7QGK1_BRAPC|nr:hypothetical protein BpHYR1_026479 [Brachionus plicatilis]
MHPELYIFLLLIGFYKWNIKLLYIMCILISCSSSSLVVKKLEDWRPLVYNQDHMKRKNFFQIFSISVQKTCYLGLELVTLEDPNIQNHQHWDNKDLFYLETFHKLLSPDLDFINILCI